MKPRPPENPAAAPISSAGLPPQIDSSRFCADQSHVEGVVAAGELPRLAESLSGSVGSVGWSFDGERRQPVEGGTADWLHLRARLNGQRPCARCDAPAAFECSIDRLFRLAADEAAAARADAEADDHDVLVASRRFSLAELLEDECLLALPGYVSHADCAEVRGDGEVRAPEGPFATLAALRKGGGRRDGGR